MAANKSHAKNRRTYQSSTVVAVFLKTRPLNQQYPALNCVLYVVLVISLFNTKSNIFVSNVQYGPWKL